MALHIIQLITHVEVDDRTWAAMVEELESLKDTGPQVVFDQVIVDGKIICEYERPEDPDVPKE
jgi:hypothetical protein